MLDFSRQNTNISGGFITPKVSTNKAIKSSLRPSPIEMSDGLIVTEFISKPDINSRFVLSIQNQNTSLQLKKNIQNTKSVIGDNTPKMTYKVSSHEIQAFNSGD